MSAGFRSVGNIGMGRIVAHLPERAVRAIGGLIAAFEIGGEFLAADGGQIERKQRIVGHGGGGTGLMREVTRWSNDLLRELAAFRQSRRKTFQRRA